MYEAEWRYSVDETEKIVRVIDTGDLWTRSVTNDAENVVAKLVSILGSLEGYEVLYQDSMGRWDGIRVENDKFAGFYPGHIRDPEN